MTKQEEIREGIARRIPMSPDGRPDYKLADIILESLHSQDVVIKAEDVLSEFYTSKMPTAVGMANKYLDIPKGIECGCYEPLIGKR